MGNTPSRKQKQAKPQSGSQQKSLVSWFEIPAVNFERAVKFYNYILGIEMKTAEVNAYRMALFPEETGGGGAVVSGEGSMPGESGPLLYLHAGPDLDSLLGRIEEAGGKVILPATLISEDSGHFAVFMDTEGNKMALHSK